VPLAALGVGHRPVVATGDEDMQGQGVMLAPQFFQGGLGFTKRQAELFQSGLKPICAHTVQVSTPASGMSIIGLPSDWKPGHSGAGGISGGTCHQPSLILPRTDERGRRHFPSRR
jgi:hypothetical protein